MRVPVSCSHFVGCIALFTTIFASSASAQVSLQTPKSPRITQAIEESTLVTLRGNTPALAQSGFDQGPASASMPANRLLLVLTRSTEQEAELQTHLQSVQDANSPNFRKFLSPEEFGQRFGVSDSDLQSIQTWLASHGFTAIKVSKGRTSIEFSGTVGQIQSAFHTTLHSYLIGGIEHFANATDPQIPTALAPVVAGLASLNSFKPKAHFIRGPSGHYDAQSHTITPAYTNGDATNGYYIYLGPADAATIYDTPTSLNATPPATTYNGSGVTIGIAGDSNIDITQNANYRSTFGLAANPLTVVVDGADPGENGDAIEAYLDTEVSGGIAPNAKVILYTAADTTLDPGLFLAIIRALDDNQADILNVSFGGCESAQGTAGNQFIQNLWEQAAAQGISVTVSTGDSGSAGCDNPNTEYLASNGLAVNGLGSTPYNIAVGGTDYDILYSNFPASFTSYIDLSNTLPNHRSALKYIPEEPWNDSTLPNTNIAANAPISLRTGNQQSDNISAGGGGISSVYPVPAWQAGFATGAGRNLPDVSLLAGNGFYGAVWGLCTDQDAAGADCAAGATGNSFNLTGVGGTSAAAPAFAGTLALLKQKIGTRLGQADYALYDLARTNYAGVFHDVTTGDISVNCTSGTSACSLDAAGYLFMTGYNAKTGCDQASGLGSVDAAQLLNNWAGVNFLSTNSSLQLNGGIAALNITHGQSVAVADSVTSTGGTPTGDIALVDSLSPANNPNSEGIAGFTLASGSASGATNSLPGGTYNVSAHYGGSSTFGESDSNSIPVTVAPESSKTLINLVTTDVNGVPTSFAAGEATYGNGYQFLRVDVGDSAASVPATSGVTSNCSKGISNCPTGKVTLSSPGTALDGLIVNLNSEGYAELYSLATGSYSISASYSGDASYKASIGTVSFTIGKAPTTVSANVEGLPVQYGNSEEIAAGVNTTSNGVAPGGTFQFFVDGSPITLPYPVVLEGFPYEAPPAYSRIEYATLSGTDSTAFMSVGNHTLSVQYTGDANYAANSSPATAVTVVQANPDFLEYGVTPNPLLVGQAATAAATLDGSHYGALPTGTVTFFSNGVAIPGTPTYAPSTLGPNILYASMPVVFNSAGTYQITMTYSGDANYTSASVAVAQTLTVTTPGSFTASATAVTLAPGATTGNTSTITLTPSGGFTGSVAITAALTSSPTGAQDLPTFSFGTTSPVSITGASAGTATLTISTTAPASATLIRPALPGIRWYQGGAALACLLLFGIPARRRRWRTLLGMLFFLAFVTGGVVSCGGGGGGGGSSTPPPPTNPGTTAGSYVITVTATSGATTTTGTVALTVQ